MDPLPIEKLPKWAQKHIADLARERHLAVRKLREFCDTQTPSKVYVEELVSTGEERGPVVRRTYVQADTVFFKHAGIELRVSVFRDNFIHLSWDSIVGRGGWTIGIKPVATNCIELRTGENFK